jgi:hypothetical protein
MRIQTYKNGKIIVSVDGIIAWANGKISPKVYLSDEQNRYSMYRYEGIALGDGTDKDAIIFLLNQYIQEYMLKRGSRTSWTIKDDAWYKKWEKKRNILFPELTN